MKKIIGIIECVILISIYSPTSSSQGRFRCLATLTGDSIGDIFSVVTNVGDVNSDGYDDLIVGAYGGNYAKLYLGGSVFDTIPEKIFHGDQPFSRFGYALAGGKDINGDGYPDFVIGAPYYWYGGRPFGISESGRVSVFFGGPTLDTIPDVELNCDGWYYNFGTSVALGDINGDGYADIIVGANNDDIDARGRVAVYWGGKEIHTTPDLILEGQPFDNLGTSVAFAGDVNKDGYGDLLIGAPQFLLTGSRLKGGKAYLVYGGKNISLAKSTLFAGDSIPPGQFGRVVAGLGDINNDGFNDIGIMGLMKQKIFLGSTSVDTAAYRSLYPLKGFSFIGGLGDVDKDGCDDFVSVSDSIRIYKGSSSLHVVPDFVLPWGYPVCCLNNTVSEKQVTLVYGENTYSIGFGKVYVYAFDKPDGIKHVSDDMLPKQISLCQNYPNPFNPSTTISFTLPTKSLVTLKIYDVLGKEVATLANEELPAGTHSRSWNAGAMSSGVYFYRFQTGSYNETKRLSFLQ
jgi:hypothetical protein